MARCEAVHVRELEKGKTRHADGRRGRKVMLKWRPGVGHALDEHKKRPEKREREKREVREKNEDRSRKLREPKTSELKCVGGSVQKRNGNKKEKSDNGCGVGVSGCARPPWEA